MKAPDIVYIDLNQYGVADHVHESPWNDGDNIKYIREDAIHNIIKEIVCKCRTLPLTHVILLEKLIKKIKAL